ncbi:unnamed protein product, partial [Allacma fusca]
MLYYGAETAELLRNVEFLWNILQAQNLSRSMKKTFVVYFFGLFSTVAVMTSSMAIKELELYHAEKYFKSSFFDADQRPLLFAAIIVMDAFMLSSMAFALSFYIFVGMRLLAIYSAFAATFETQWRIEFLPEKISCVCTMEAGKIFDLIIKSVDLFNDICGLNTFVLIFTHELVIVAYISTLTTASWGYLLTGTLSCICIITIISNLGHHAESMVRLMKQNVQRAFVNNQCRTFVFGK